MVADQVVKQSDGTEITIPGVGGFDYDAEYRRWGFSPYISYELRSTSGAVIGTGPSLGFCVIDTSNPNPVLPGEPPAKVYTEKASCGKKGADGKTGDGLAAGGHYDPEMTGKHEGPEGKGHKGDLPALTVDDKGNATKAVTAPQLKVADLWGHALMIHEGGDNYADQPKPLGGGGGRIACDTIKKAGAKKM